MKRFILSLSIVATLLAVTSCEDDGGDITINQTINNNGGGNGNGNGNGNTDAINITGNVNSGETLTLDASKTYKINGALIVRDGGKLVIPAGTKITAESGPGVYIAVTQGGLIDAQGTASEPIILTSTVTEPGAWGGLIVLGKAPINSGEVGTSEIGQFPYGGTQANDNSGIIQYVVIEYSGAAVDASSENNGFSFYGVGSGTTVDYIESYYGSDDGIEFFGGTVNASHLIMIGNEDDSVDWTEGFSGTLTDVYVRHEGSEWDKAFECDGFNPDLGVNVDPAFYSHPTINNAYVKGLGSGTTQQGGDPITAGDYEAVRLREATQAEFNNIVIEGFGRGFRLRGNDSGSSVVVTTADQVANNTLNATAKFVDVTNPFVVSDGLTINESDFLTINDGATGTNVSVWGASWAVGL